MCYINIHCNIYMSAFHRAQVCFDTLSTTIMRSDGTPTTIWLQAIPAFPKATDSDPKHIVCKGHGTTRTIQCHQKLLATLLLFFKFYVFYSIYRDLRMNSADQDWGQDGVHDKFTIHWYSLGNTSRTYSTTCAK